MIFTLDNKKTIDTAAMTAEERHIIQKLMAWQSLAPSLAFYREKQQAALQAGWNQSGPVRPGPGLAAIMRILEKQLLDRLG